MAHKGFDELEFGNCNISYRFLVSDSISNTNPLFLEIIQKDKTLVLDDGSPLSILTVRPYIKCKKNCRLYFYYQSSNDCIMPVRDNDSQNNQPIFQFNVLIYGMTTDDILSIHVYNMQKKTNDDAWFGLLRDLTYVIKSKVKHMKQSSVKWVTNPFHFNYSKSHNCSLVLLYEKINTKKTKYMIIRNKSGIIGVHDIYLLIENQIDQSMKDQFNIDIQSDDTCYLTPKKNNLIGKRFVLDLWLKSKNQRIRYYFRLKPGNTLNIDHQEFIELQKISLVLKLFNQNNYPVRIPRKRIEILDCLLDGKPISIDHNAFIESETIKIKEQSLKFRKGQKLSFKILTGQYFPKKCEHVITNNPNIIVRLTEAPIPKIIENITNHAVIVMDERGRKPLGTIKLFDQNDSLLATSSQSNIFLIKKKENTTKIIFKGNEFYDKSHAIYDPQADNHFVHLYLPELKKTLWFNFKDKKTQKQLSEMSFTLVNNQITYHSKSDTLTIPVYMNDAFHVDVNSDQYITAYGQKTLFQCKGDYNHCHGFSENHPIDFNVDKIIMINPKIRLICNINGKKKDVYDDEIDEEIMINIARANVNKTNIYGKQMTMVYNETQKAFEATLPSPASKKTFWVNIISDKFETIKQELELTKSDPIEIEMKFNTPLLYMLINPSKDFLMGPLHKNKINNFKRFKNRFYETMAYLENTKPWEGIWSSLHFFVKYSNAIERLIQTNDIKPKWYEETIQEQVVKKIVPEFDHSTITCNELIDEGINFINKYSLSDTLPLKGVMLMITARSINPLKLEMIGKIQQRLHENQMGAVIARFGILKENDFNYTSDKTKFKNLTIVEYNIEREFNDKYFGNALKKIRKELWGLMYRNGFGLGHLVE